MDAKMAIAVRQPVNPHAAVVIRPEIRLAPFLVNIHPLMVGLLGSRLFHLLRRRTSVLNGTRLLLCRVHFLPRLFRSSHRLRLPDRLRLADFRLAIHLRLWTRRGLHWSAAAAIVSAQAAPVGGMKVGTNCAD